MSKKTVLIYALFFVRLCVAQEADTRWSYLFDQSEKKGFIKDKKDYYLLDGDHLLIKQISEKNIIPVRRLSASKWVVRIADTAIVNGHEELLKSVNNLWKLSDNIFDLKQKKKLSFLVKTLSFDTAVMQINYPDIDFVHVRGDLFSIETTRDVLYKLVDEPWILFISHESTISREESRVIDLNLNPNRISKLHRRYPGIDGQGVVISIQERAFDTNDLDLIGRSVASVLRASEETSHATEMATIIAGAGNSFITGLGVAPGAALASSNFEMPLPDQVSDYLNLNVFVQNHSYGTIVENFYGLEAEAFDVIANELPQLLHVFSSGNSGLEVSEEGVYAGLQGYGNLTGNFKSAKNILLIGSADTLYRSLDFISRGPCFDGRVKPDLSAYSMVGSSNSAALVSGTVALLQQSYLENHNEFPLSDLLKAILICTSTDIDAPGPDHIRGFGNLDAFKALELLNANRYWQDTLSNGEEITFELNVPANVSGLKVVLAWIDPPANPGDHAALINDLNVELTGPSGEHYLPWVLKTDADIQKLKDPATRGLDSLNNVEMVSIDLPEAGVYQVNVTSRGLISRDQGFSLAYALDTIGQFDWDYPNQGDNFPYNGETGTYFRWSNTIAASTGLLQYQLEEENVWSTIAEVDLSVDHYRWNQVPLDQNSLARARMIISSDTFYTESFTVSRQLDAGVGFNCPDSIELKWDKVTDAVAYKIYQPGEKYLELSHQVNTNSIILSRDEITSDYFSIEPVRQDGLAYLPSYTIDYTQLEVGCFLSSFYQEVTLGEGIYLHLKLGSTHEVDRVEFESLKGEFFELVSMIEIPDTELRVLDPNPNQGHNVHRVTIYFNNGEIIQETAGGTYYLTEKPGLVFPNPVPNSGSVNVYTRDFQSSNVTFLLYDGNGREVLDYKMNSTQESVPLYDLKQGLYFYHLRAGSESYNGKLIIR